MTLDPARARLQDSTWRAVEAWIRHPVVRPVVEAPSGVRLGAAVALDPLEQSVGHLLDQYEVSWLLLRSLNAEASPSAEAGAYPTPGWADHPEVNPSGASLLKVVTALAKVLHSRGVRLDPYGIADRLAAIPFT